MITKHFDIQFETKIKWGMTPWNDEWSLAHLYRKNVIENYPELIYYVTTSTPTEEEKEEMINYPWEVNNEHYWCPCSNTLPDHGLNYVGNVLPIFEEKKEWYELEDINALSGWDKMCMTINQYFRQPQICSLIPKVKTDYGRTLYEITSDTYDTMLYNYSRMSCYVKNPDDMYEIEKPNGFYERRMRSFEIFYAHNYYQDAGAYVMLDNRYEIWKVCTAIPCRMYGEKWDRFFMYYDPNTGGVDIYELYCYNGSTRWYNHLDLLVNNMEQFDEANCSVYIDDSKKPLRFDGWIYNGDSKFEPKSYQPVIAPYSLIRYKTIENDPNEKERKVVYLNRKKFFIDEIVLQLYANEDVENKNVIHINGDISDNRFTNLKVTRNKTIYVGNEKKTITIGKNERYRNSIIAINTETGYTHVFPNLFVASKYLEVGYATIRRHKDGSSFKAVDPLYGFNDPSFKRKYYFIITKEIDYNDTNCGNIKDWTDILL
ncbi:MAG: hypothetical protein MJ126_09785 [Lachnospiraceae bacterium]|nr:hypothetical protein [Lachnospiraceae bacterium]